MSGCPEIPDRRVSDEKLSEVEAAFDRKLKDHELREQERFKLMLNAFSTEAFPDGSVAHKAAHQAMIDAARQEAEFWRGLKVEIAKKSIWGILQILTVLVLAGVAAKFGLGAIAAGVIK